MAKSKSRKGTGGRSDAAFEPGELGFDHAGTAAVAHGPTWDGPALRAAREQAGMSLEEMSNRTKINIAILRALEEERFEDTPKARVYVRGFVRCMAEEIGLDRDQVARSYVPRWERWFEDTTTRP